MATKRTRKRPTTKRNTSKKNQVKSFRISRSEVPFMTMKPSIQTLYWVILGVVVVSFAVWIFKLQSDIEAIYDRIEITSSIIYNQPDTVGYKKAND